VSIRHGWPKDELFSAPLPRPVPRLYRELRIEPDASDDEVAWAKVAATARLRREQAELRTDLAHLDQHVPGLPAASERVQQLRRPSDAEPPSPGELREAEQRLARLEREAFKRDPLVRAKRRRAREVRQAILDLAAVGLDEPKKRLAYDRAHPPLALLKLEDCAEAAFDDPRTCLFLLRSGVASFLAAQGEPVYHPSDLTRVDFTADFDHNQLLDGPP
jgi:hypothetical protein